MSDHADTIRRALEAVPDAYRITEPDGRRFRAFAALDALLAERQQAQTELTRLRVSEASWAAQATEAIDALREIAHVGRTSGPATVGLADALQIARAALLSLGEQQ